MDACLHCGLTIWLDDFEGAGIWIHMDTGQRVCPPVTVATPSTVRIG